MSQMNCPTCGAKTNSVAANCEYCGVEIAKKSVLSPQEYIQALGRCLENVGRKEYEEVNGKENAIRAAIQLFPIPSDLPCLIEFFTFCSSNDRFINEFDTSSLEKEQILAWRGKAAATYQRLQFAAMNNPRLLEVLKLEASRYSPDAMQQRTKVENKNQAIVVTIVLLVVAAIVAVMLFLNKK